MTPTERLKERVKICEDALVNVVRGATMDGTSLRYSYERLNQIASQAYRASQALQPKAKAFKRVKRARR